MGVVDVCALDSAVVEVGPAISFLKWEDSIRRCVFDHSFKGGGEKVCPFLAAIPSNNYGL